MGNKQQQVRDLATKLMEEFGLVRKGWTFQYNKRKRALGLCSHSKRSIELSIYWVDTLPMEQIETTIRHEIAHALAPRSEGHGPKWKEMCCVVGIPDEARCYSGDVRIDPIHYKWKIECPTCGKISYRHKRTYRSQSCGVCSGNVYNPQHKMVWTLNKEPQ